MTDRRHDEECGQPDAPEPGCPCWCHFDPLVYGKERDYPAAQPREEPATEARLAAWFEWAKYVKPTAEAGWHHWWARTFLNDPPVAEAAAHATERPDPDLLAVCHDAYHAWSHYFDADDRTDHWTPLCEAMDRLREAMRNADRAATERPRTEPLDERLIEAVRIILINEVPSDEAWRDLNDAYDAALARLSPPALDVERLAEAMHAEGVGCTPGICEPTPAFYVGVRKTMHETDARLVLANLSRPPAATQEGE